MIQQVCQNNPKQIGALLQEAGLLSHAQLEVVLQDQQYQPDLRVGDILVLRGWLTRDIIEFFADQWLTIVKNPIDKPLGYYLQQAGLLGAEQIQLLLQDQAQTGMRIGALAVLRGWLSQQTLDLFLQHLAPEHYGEPPFIKREISKRNMHSTQERTHRQAAATCSTNNALHSGSSSKPERSQDEEITWIG